MTRDNLMASINIKSSKSTSVLTSLDFFAERGGYEVASGVEFFFCNVEKCVSFVCIEGSDCETCVS